MPDNPLPQPVPAFRPAPLARFRDALKFEADDELVAALRAVGDAEGAGEATAALRLLAEHPRAVLRVDLAVRGNQGYSYYRQPAALRPAPPVLAPDTNPVRIALASAHPDGRVRERAVRLLGELLSRRQPPLELVPFLVLRTGDWVRAVRDRARAALALLLHEDPARFVPAAARFAVLTDRRQRGGFARQQVLAALRDLPGTTVLDQLLASPDRRLRRSALQVALSVRRLPIRRLAALAENDGDRLIRGLAAEAAVREAVWTDRLDLLRRLAESRHREVRVLAFTGLLRAGQGAEVTAHFADSSGLVRAVAREAIRRTGADAVELYRAAVQEATPALGAIAGLAETGRSADGRLLVGLLAHPRAQVRATAVRALRALGSVPVDQFVQLLRDPSARVIRDVTAALRARLDQLPPGLADSLLADRERAEVRLAGYRLLPETDLVQQLRAILGVAADPDPRLSTRAATETTTLIRRINPSPWRTKPAPAFDPTPEQRSELLALAEHAATALPHRTLQLLREWLIEAAGGQDVELP